MTHVSPAAPPSETARLGVDVFGDVVCPFCYIGLRRMANLAGPEALDLRWMPFQLRPELPAQGEEWRPFALAKFGGEEGMRRAFDHVERYACDDGLCFDFDAVASAPNTVAAHRVILLAQERGLGVGVAMSVMKGYFEEGADLRDASVLADLAARGGLPRGD
ncbi:DsbA family oxidoreductase, partial [Deinococcus pimensis]|uniref:DsbA family oxidoreductase n=1 Tax=Deinococcus pimensis TaxID=309888 RepID=UPI0004843806